MKQPLKGNITAIIIIIAIVAITAGVMGWLIAKQSQIPVAQPVMPIVQTQPQNQTIPPQAVPTQQNLTKVDWNAIQFDACGKKDKYEKLPWWNNFSAQIAKYNYYSDNYVDSVIKSANENKYLNPDKIKYTRENYCNYKSNSNSTICGNGKDKKLSITDLDINGEGCLAKDGSAFVVVFPGEYMGGGNYVFRYDINNNFLEEAQKVNETKTYGSYWVDPPSAFGKRIGNIIKMTGGAGDAGCGSETEFDYNIIANTIKMTNRCWQCEGEKPKCTAY